MKIGNMKIGQHVIIDNKYQGYVYDMNGEHIAVQPVFDCDKYQDWAFRWLTPNRIKLF